MGAVLAFCLLAVATRELNRAIPVQEIVLFRALTGLIITTALILALRQPALFRTRRPGMQLVRHGFHFFGQCGWLFGIGYLTLADVFALEFTVPVWVALIAALFLRERLTAARCVAIVMGVIGVVIIVNPTTGLFDDAAFVVLGAAVFYAIAHTANKSLAHTETALGLIFYMSLIQLPIGIVLSAHAWITPEGFQWIWLISIGICALVGHYCLTRAMQLADVSFVMTVDFLRLPLVAIIGVLLYLEPLKVSLLVGGVVILVSNMINVRDQLDRTLHQGRETR
ncbi:MAG: DMT family transporter [Gammaproteobacteria bacterium]|nr:DMT family transporter [Gammaproteobacteria bacterium]MBT4493921.1 DMT family transporter [Gammaproteobacteria bacterium]MBT7369352.1 DMT family transporter [Gammaproteobacteria bacterium]